MRVLRRFAAAAVVAAAAGGPALAQTSGASGFGLGSTSNTGGTGGSGGGTSANSLPTNSATTSAGATLTTLTAPGQILAPSKTQTGTVNQNVSTSNFLGNYYGNPNYMGLSSNPLGQPAGGFGAMLYQTPGVTAVSTITGSGRTGTTGGRGTTGGLGGTSSGAAPQDPGGQIVTLPRQISYVAQVRFQAPTAPPAQVAADLRGMIDRTTMIANPAGVQLLMDAPTQTVVLRGAVRDEDEARTVEGMVRLTPGVRAVKSELTYPKP